MTAAQIVLKPTALLLLALLLLLDNECADAECIFDFVPGLPFFKSIYS